MTGTPPYKLYGTTTGFYPTTGTIPKGLAGTGTLVSLGVKLTGTGTLFLTQLRPGDFIFTNGGQLLEIVTVTSDTLAITKVAANPVLAGATFTICRATFKRVQIQNIGAGSSTILGEKIVTGQVINLPDHFTNGEMAKIPVLFYDATVSELAIITL